MYSLFTYRSCTSFLQLKYFVFLDSLDVELDLWLFKQYWNLLFFYIGTYAKIRIYLRCYIGTTSLT